MTKRLAWLGLAALVFTACIAHEKVGDQAAAVGDWKTALAEYREAYSKEPENPQLKEKFERSKREAIADAYKTAQACATAGNWGCAVGEADFALSVDSGNTEIAAFRATAARSLALQQIAQARDEATKGQFRSALQLIDKSQALSSDAAVAQAASSARTGLAASADTEAERLRQAKAYPEAVDALSVAVSIDGSKRGKLDALQREYDGFRAAEYERLAQQGDQALSSRNWAAAQDSYMAALQMNPGGRAEPLARYAGGVGAAEAALARRDYFAAADAYRQALASGQDASGYAAAQLELVEVRPYTVRIHSVLARPMRPDGRPWVGNMNPYMARLLGMFSGDFMDPSGRGANRRLIEAARSLPPENRPNLSVRVSLPDGTMLATPSVNGLYVAYDSEFVVATNSFDERRLNLRVVHANGNFFEDVGVVEFPLGEIVRRHEAHLGGQSVASIDLTIDPAPGRYDGMFANMFPLNDGSNLAQDYSVPSDRSRGYRLRGVRAQVPPQALALRPNGGAGNLVVELVQAGRVVYHSPQVDNLYEAQWAVSNVSLFVQPGEQLRVLIWDMNAGTRTLMLDAVVSAEQFTQGAATVNAANGSAAFLVLEPRQVWAGGIAP